MLVNFTIDENGKTENVYISNSNGDTIDSLLVKAIENSPKWITAISHNRKVKQNLFCHFLL